VEAVKDEIRDSEYSRGRLYKRPDNLRKRDELSARLHEAQPIEPNTYVHHHLWTDTDIGYPIHDMLRTFVLGNWF